QIDGAHGIARKRRTGLLIEQLAEELIGYHSAALEVESLLALHDLVEGVARPGRDDIGMDGALQGVTQLREVLGQQDFEFQRKPLAGEAIEDFRGEIGIPGESRRLCQKFNALSVKPGFADQK